MKKFKPAILLFLFIAFTGAFNTQAQVIKSTLRYKDTLALDVYQTGSAGQQPPALLVLMHGGGFESGQRDGNLESAFCQKMAQKGYLVASISYRLTRKNDPFSCDCDTAKKMSSFVSAVEDLSDAVYFLKAQQNLVFDRDKLVLIGSSAGAEAVLHAAFMGHDYRFKHIAQFPVSGVVSFSGAVANGSYISKENAVPALFTHGKKDELVPYGTAPHHLCSEERAGYLMLDGPQTLSTNLKRQGTSFILAFDPEGKHDWSNKAFGQTELVDRFIRDLVLGKKFVQSVIELDENTENAEASPDLK